MQKSLSCSLGAALLAVASWAADSPLAKVYEGQLSMIEGEIVPLVEAMPANQFGFAPSSGEFKGVRTFGAQAKHVATVIYMTAAAAKGEKPPLDLGKGEEGPESVKTKEEIVKFLKGSFAYAHSAAQILNEKNQLDMLASPFGSKMTRVAIVSIPVWHTFDHYGQMVVYARMNGVVPPASRPAPPPAAAKK
jgi:hypothetical protein